MLAMGRQAKEAEWELGRHDTKTEGPATGVAGPWESFHSQGVRSASSVLTAELLLLGLARVGFCGYSKGAQAASKPKRFLQTFLNLDKFFKKRNKNSRFP